MFETIPYNRIAAAEYAKNWAFKRNPAFYDFSDIGGDCTNYISQCLYAGCPYMNYSGDTGWYYISPDSRSAAWSGVDFFYNFAVSNKGAGFFGRLGGIEEMAVGDIIQLGNSENRYYHTLFVCGFTPRDILVAAHSFDAYMHPLSSYHYSVIRCIKILGGRKPV